MTKELKSDVPSDAELVERRSGDFVGGPARRTAAVRGSLYWLRWQFPILLVLLALFGLSYQSRSRAADQTNRANRVATHVLRAGCRRGMVDRRANMESWYAAYLSRVSQAKVSTGAQKAAYLASAATYLWTVQSDLARVNAYNSLTWPLESHTQPLGTGTFDCIAAYPSLPLVTTPLVSVFN